MQRLLKDAVMYRGGKLCRGDVALSQGRIICSSALRQDSEVSILSLKGKLLIPGLVDVHVHLREPGFSDKETIWAGSRGGARGGYTALCAMPNVNPPPDCVDHVRLQQDIIDRDAAIHVYPYGTLTMGRRGKGELTDYEALSPFVIAFSDDGRGIQNEDTMREAMRRVHSLGGLIAAHCEESILLHGGYIHEGAYAARMGHRGICSESEWRQVARDLRLAAETQCRYHVCHVSARESVALIRKAKGEGVDVTCETAPHYLLLHDGLLQEDGRWKMNPPIRSQADREALLEGLQDGTVDMIATDHAPHCPAEKSRGLAGSAMGVAGLECAFAILYTGLVKAGLLPLELLLKAMTDAPRRRFHLAPATLGEGEPADLTVFDLDAQGVINSGDFISKGRATPFDGMEAYGRCMMTLVGGETVWESG